MRKVVLTVDIVCWPLSIIGQYFPSQRLLLKLMISMRLHVMEERFLDYLF